MEPQLTDVQVAELRRLKQYFPYRIIFGTLGPNGEFEAFADTTKRRMNAKLRAGYAVFTLG